MVPRARICAENKAFVRFLKTQGNKSVRQVAEMCGISIATVSRITRKDIKDRTIQISSKRTGRPRKIDERSERQIVRAVKRLRRINGNFRVKDIMRDCNISETDVNIRTVQRVLNRNGFYFLQARKKGLMRNSDLRKRLQFARKIKRKGDPNFWKADIMFYFDGAAFAHKTNPMEQARAPRGRIWRKKSEGLAFGCTAKGQKTGTGGKVVRIFASISYGKGVVLAKAYKKLSGPKFANFVKKRFPKIIRKCQDGKKKQFLQDGDPSQNSGAATEAFAQLGMQVFTIPPRSPDLNPIENIFKILNEELRREALSQRIHFETFKQFKKRIIRT